jgi:Cupin domain
VGAAVTTRGAVAGRVQAEAALASEGCSAPRPWTNRPGDVYGWHAHDYHKVLFCLDGSIVFHTRGGDVALRHGDRLDIAAGTEHAATVGADGCACIEAARRGAAS